MKSILSFLKGNFETTHSSCKFSRTDLWPSWEDESKRWRDRPLQLGRRQTHIFRYVTFRRRNTSWPSSLDVWSSQQRLRCWETLARSAQSEREHGVFSFHVFTFQLRWKDFTYWSHMNPPPQWTVFSPLRWLSMEPRSLITIIHKVSRTAPPLGQHSRPLNAERLDAFASF